MAFSLATIPDPAPKPDPIPTLPGSAIADDCRLSVRHVCGRWGDTRSLASDCERDALQQSLALWCLEHPARLIDRETGYPLAPQQRRAVLRDVLKRDLLRDSRHWRDSLENVPVSRERPRTAEARRIAESGSTVAEQAERFRRWEASRKPAPHTSMEVLASEYRDAWGDLLWTEIAAHQEREVVEGQAIHPYAIADDSADLVETMAEMIADDLADRDVTLESSARAQLRAALLSAIGERVDAIATELGCGRATADRRIAAGRRILETARNFGVDIVAIRRDAVATVADTSGEEYEPQSAEQVDMLLGVGRKRQAIDRAIGTAEREAVARAAGSESRPRPATVRAETVATASGKRTATVRYADVPRGPARDVCAYIARIQRAYAIAERPACTLDTSDPRPVPPIAPLSVLSAATGPALPVWHPPTVSLTGTVSGNWTNRDKARLWPDDTVAGDAVYRARTHPAVLRDVISRQAGERVDSFAAPMMQPAVLVP